MLVSKKKSTSNLRGTTLPCMQKTTGLASLRQRARLSAGCWCYNTTCAAMRWSVHDYWSVGQAHLIPRHGGDAVIVVFIALMVYWVFECHVRNTARGKRVKKLYYRKLSEDGCWKCLGITVLASCANRSNSRTSLPLRSWVISTICNPTADELVELLLSSEMGIGRGWPGGSIRFMSCIIVCFQLTCSSLWSCIRWIPQSRWSR